MVDCKPCATPVDTNAKVASAFGVHVADATQFQSLIGALQDLTFTWLDIPYAIQHICIHMHDPREPHLNAIKRLLHYLHGTLDYGLLLHHSASTSELVVYIDANWTDCLDTQRSISGYVVFLGDNLVS